MHGVWRMIGYTKHCTGQMTGEKSVAVAIWNRLDNVLSQSLLEICQLEKCKFQKHRQMIQKLLFQG